MKENSVKIFSDHTQLSQYAAEYLLNKIEKTGENKISIALSGGSTPKNIYKHIANNYSQKIDWNKVKLFFGDERCVPSTDEQSNYKMVSNTLLRSINITPENIFKIDGEDQPEVEAKRYSAVLKEELSIKNGIPQFDIVLLGIGEDGHTVSIFPDQIKKFHSKNFCEPATHPETGQKRVTITGQIINNANLVVFIAVGKNKSRIISEVLSNSVNKYSYPAALVDPVKGKLAWLLDEDAVALL